MKKVALALAIIANLIVFIPTAHADQCFSNIPDSAWQNGEPAEVTSQLNHDLASRVEIAPKVGVDVLPLYSNLPIKTTYLYSGKNCQARTIIVPSIYNRRVSLLGASDFSVFAEKHTKDFLAAQEVTAALGNMTTIFTSKNYSLEVNSKTLLSEKNIGNFLLSDQEKQKVAQLLYAIRQVRGSTMIQFEPTLILKSNDACLSFQNSTSDSIDLAPYKTAEYLLGNGSNLLFKKMNACTISIYLMDFNSVVRPNTLAIEQYFVADINVTPIIASAPPAVKKLVVINCWKSKTLKQVKGVNPTCPPGYKQKA